MNHPNRGNWSKRLKSFRKKHSLTQKMLADRLPTSLRNVENWEADIYKPPSYLKRALTDIEREL